jgi:hypothetical protein
VSDTNRGGRNEREKRGRGRAMCVRAGGKTEKRKKRGRGETVCAECRGGWTVRGERKKRRGVGEEEEERKKRKEMGKWVCCAGKKRERKEEEKEKKGRERERERCVVERGEDKVIFSHPISVRHVAMSGCPFILKPTIPINYTRIPHFY